MDFLLEFSSNQIILYIILFFASFLDSFIFTSIFVVGEIFFVSGGYLGFQDLNIFIVYFLLVLAALIGDNISYFIGKKYSKNIFSKNGRFFNQKQLSFGEKLIKKYGVKIVFLGRIIGPFYWIIPTISGTFGLDYKKFFIFNFFGVSLGVFHFMAYGYFFASGFSYFGNSVFVNIILFITLIYFLFLFIHRVFYFIKERKYFPIFILFGKYFLSFFMIFLFTLTYYYFYLYPIDAHFYDKNNKISNLEDFIKNMDKKIYSDKVIKTNSNPINLVIVTDKNIEKIMKKILWEKNLSFSSGEISFRKFFHLIYLKTPPISDYYHESYNQNFQFQDFSNSNSKRNHIRFWEVGKTKDDKNIYIGSVSKDKNYAIMINNGLPIIGHSIYKNIDLTRDFFLELLKDNFEKIDIKTLDYPSFKRKNYYTDGDIFLIEIN